MALNFLSLRRLLKRLLDLRRTRNKNSIKARILVMFCLLVTQQQEICIIYSRGRQPTARVPHLARQAFSNGTEKLHILHITFVTIRNEGALTLTCTNIRMLLAHWMTWNLKLAHNQQKVADPWFAVMWCLRFLIRILEEFVKLPTAFPYRNLFVIDICF